MTKEAEDLIYEVRVLYQTLLQFGEQIHGESPISMGMRAVLEYLSRFGDATVPDMARARRVTRQRIQALVNDLSSLDLVTTRDNPASKRSPLIALTKAGARNLRDMRKREGEWLEVDIPAARLRQAKQTLIDLREALESTSP